LSEGAPLSIAIEALGITLEEAQTYIESRLQNVSVSTFALRETANGALTTAIEKLTKLAGEAPRRTQFDQKLYNTDLDAAKALARIAIDALKVSGGTKDPAKQQSGSSQPDLWDVQRTNWDDLRKPE
jgi:hypothetical protein